MKPYLIESLNIRVRIPSGWRVIEAGKAKKNDLAWGEFDGKFTPVIEFEFNWDADDFHCLIRKVAK